MRFKRDWSIVYRDIYCGFILVGIVTIPVYWATIKARQPEAILLVFLLHILFYAMSLLCYYFSGVFTNIIILDNDGITFQQKKKPSQQIRWEEISRIIRTRYIGGKTLVFRDI